MQIKLFTIPITDTGALLEEMNRFLRANKVLETDHHLVSNERGAFWCFCVKFIDSQPNTFPNAGQGGKIDYKQLLDEAAFKTFSKLREIRKQIATDEAIPAYAVFTDEELAGLAKLSGLTPQTMATVKGIGDKKVERFAQKVIAAFEDSKTE